MVSVVPIATWCTYGDYTEHVAANKDAGETNRAVYRSTGELYTTFKRKLHKRWIQRLNSCYCCRLVFEICKWKCISSHDCSSISAVCTEPKNRRSLLRVKRQRSFQHFLTKHSYKPNSALHPFQRFQVYVIAAEGRCFQFTHKSVYTHISLCFVNKDFGKCAKAVTCSFKCTLFQKFSQKRDKA